MSAVMRLPSPSIINMAMSCIVCEIYRLIGGKTRNFYTPLLFSAPQGWGDPVGISWKCLMLVKLALGYRTVKKLWQHVKPFSSDTGTSRMDGRTDRRTDRQNIAISISRVSVLTLDKNCHFSTNRSLYFENNTRDGHSYNVIRIGTRMRSIKRCHFQWPRVTPNLDLKVTVLFNVK